MTDFNPDTYLAEKLKPQPTPTDVGFNPDTYLASKTSQSPTPAARTFTPNAQEEMKPSFANEIGQNLKTVAHTTTENLPALGMMVGGTAGAAVGGTVTLGTAAIPSAVAGSAAGGAIGSFLKDAVNQIFYPEEAPNTAGQVITNAATQGLVGATLEAAVPFIASEIKAVPEALDAASKYIGTKVIPNMQKALGRLGGEEGLKRTAQLLDDYGVTNTIGTLAKVKDRLVDATNVVGNALERGYAKLDQVASKRFTVAQLVDRTLGTVEDMIDTGAVKNIKALSDSEKKSITNQIYDYFGNNPNAVISHAKVSNVARTIEGKMYDRALPQATQTLSGAIGTSLREANGAFAEAAAPEIAPQVKNLSDAYGKLATVRKLVSDKVGKGTSTIGEAIQAGKYIGVHAAAGNKAALVMGAYDLAKTAPVKTTASATLKGMATFGAKLLSYVPEMGPFGKTMLRIAADKGPDAVAKFHAYQMVHNAKYHDTYMQATGGSISELNSK